MDLAIHTPVPYGSASWAVLKKSPSARAVAVAVIYQSKWSKNWLAIDPSGDVCIARVFREFCHTVHLFLALGNWVLANSGFSMSLMAWLANSQFSNMNEILARSNNAFKSMCLILSIPIDTLWACSGVQLLEVSRTIVCLNSSMCFASSGLMVVQNWEPKS